jgi:preprotein translocase subunit SecG
MQLFITILHIVLSICMILIILLQPGKEGGAALAGGSSGNQMYGPRGAGNLLGRATTVVAAGFMVTSITLAYYSSEKVQSGSDIEDAIRELDDEDEALPDADIPLPAEPATPSTITPIAPTQDAG